MQEKSRSPKVGFEGLDTWYCAALEQGAFGGTLRGAGGGGFLFFLAPLERHDAIRRSLAGLDEMPVSFVSGGSQIGGST